MEFYVNNKLIDKARSVLGERKNLYWIIGGSGTGKSTICRTISEQKTIALYDMDEHIFGGYMSSYSEDRHPASKAWFSAQNPLAWALSLSLEEFDAFNKAANAEYLDLLADDLKERDGHESLLIDGGITHPTVLTQVISPENIFCLAITKAESVRLWETSEARAPMKEWVLALPDPEEMWKKFLKFDRLISHTIVTESREIGIEPYLRDTNTSVEGLANIIADYFRI